MSEFLFQRRAEALLRGYEVTQYRESTYWGGWVEFWLTTSGKEFPCQNTDLKFEVLEKLSELYDTLNVKVSGGDLSDDDENPRNSLYVLINDVPALRTP